MCSRQRTDIGRNQLWSYTAQHTFDVSYSEDWDIVRPYVKVPRKEGRKKGREAERRREGQEGRGGKKMDGKEREWKKREGNRRREGGEEGEREEIEHILLKQKNRMLYKDKKQAREGAQWLK